MKLLVSSCWGAVGSGFVIHFYPTPETCNFQHLRTTQGIFLIKLENQVFRVCASAFAVFSSNQVRDVPLCLPKGQEFTGHWINSVFCSASFVPCERKRAVSKARKLEQSRWLKDHCVTGEGFGRPSPCVPDEYYAFPSIRDVIVNSANTSSLVVGPCAVLDFAGEH